MNDICYWCGEPSTSKDHVPPQNLFPEGHRKNLIKIDACKKHNEEFSKLDERMRYHMTVMGDEVIARQHYESKTLKGLMRPQGMGLTMDLAQNSFNDRKGKKWQRDSTDSFDLYFEKIIRGLFFYHYKKHISGSTSYFSNKMQHFTMSANAHFYYHLLEDDLSDNWINGSSENKEVFSYKYFYSETEDRFFTVMMFYGVHKVIGVSLPPGKTIDSYGLNYEDYQKRIENKKRST